MARTKVFISSTYYDLKQIRGDLENFLNNLNYDSILHETGKIPYGKTEKLENYCYKEIKNADIVVCVIGGKYGSESEHGGSITQNELKQAILENKKVYIFIEEKVFTEFYTWQKNKDIVGINYSYVDNPKIYEFIEEIQRLNNNNQIKDFSKTSDIIDYLKEQWSALFHEYLIEEVKKEELSLAKELRKQITDFKDIIEFVKNSNEKVNETLKDFYYLKNNFLDELIALLKSPKTFYIKNLDDLDSILECVYTIIYKM